MAYLIAVALLLQTTYWLALRRGVRRMAPRPPAGHRPPISVVVAVRNEEARLPRLLASLERQQHPCFEVVVVDDGSTDRTAEMVERSTARFEGLRCIRLESGGKKRALAAGIEAAAYDVLAFTDADCEPRPGWLTSLARYHGAARGDAILVGYSPFRHSNGSLLERLARYETFVTGFMTAGAAGLGRPYMAVGRNVSYPKSVFLRAGGFEAIMHSLSGDDDLFLQEAVRREAADVQAILDPESFVPTESPQTWGEWLRQKRRHASAGRHYRPSVQAHLALFHGSALLVWIAPLLVGWPGGVVLGLRLIVQHAALRDGGRRLGEEQLLRIQPLMEPLYVLYNTILAPAALLFAPRRW